GMTPAELPNVCKMPGPPAPFVPTPLPNIGQSSDNLTGCTTTVKIEGAKIAIKGSYYMSKGDMASKGTGGGMVSATTHGKTEFVAPGSTDVKFQGKNVQLLGDAMTNNGNMANVATPANIQDPNPFEGAYDEDAKAICEAFCQALKDGPLKKGEKWTDRFKSNIDKRKDPGMATEPWYYMPNKGGKPELLTPDLFKEMANNVR